VVRAVDGKCLVEGEQSGDLWCGLLVFGGGGVVVGRTWEMARWMDDSATVTQGRDKDAKTQGWLKEGGNWTVLPYLVAIALQAANK
jgi:hypothetical protein